MAEEVPVKKRRKTEGHTNTPNEAELFVHIASFKNRQFSGVVVIAQNVSHARGLIVKEKLLEKYKIQDIELTSQYVHSVNFIGRHENYVPDRFDVTHKALNLYVCYDHPFVGNLVPGCLIFAESVEQARELLAEMLKLHNIKTDNVHKATITHVPIEKPMIAIPSESILKHYKV